MFILGAAKVGPVNLGKAMTSLGPKGNAELKQLMEHSNFTGGFTADSAAVTAQASTFQNALKPLVKLFKADKANADRVGLASLYQYRQSKAVLNGYKGTDEEFALDLFQGRLDPSMALDAWAHAAESMSRTLGVDPLKVNMDVFSSSVMGPYIGVFVKQPARTINLLADALANNKPDRFYTILGAMTLFAGASAMSAETQEIWKNLDPKAYFMIAATLNRANIPAALTGKTLELKSRYSTFFPLQAASDPLRRTAGQSITAAVDILRKAITDRELNVSKMLTAVANIASIALPSIKGVPVKPVLGATKAGYESYGVPGFEDAQGKRIHYFGTFNRYADSESVPLDELGISPVQNTIGSFIPGEWTSVRERQLAKEEEYYLKNSIWGDLSDSPRQFRADAKQSDATSALLNWLFPGRAAR